MKEKALKMDSSSRVLHILEQDVRVDVSRMSPEEWLEIIKKAVKIARPQLKYLPYCQPIEIFTNRESGFGQAVTLTPESILTFKDEEINKRTKCEIGIFVLNNESSTEKLYVQDTFCDVTPPKEITRDEIILSVNGDFIYW